MILYKYRQRSEKTDQIFKDRVVWLSKPAKLNDPCECSMHELAPAWIEKRIHEVKAAQMSGAIWPSSANSAFQKEIMRTLHSITDFDEKYKTFRKIYARHFGVNLSNPDDLFVNLEKQLAQLGVFSLASFPDHPLMWSHYARQHEGLCLGFELRDLTPSTDPMRFLKIRYSDEMPKFNESGFNQEISFSIGEDGELRNESSIPLTDQSARAAISAKSTCWEYEGEWRYVEREGDRTYPFPGPLVEMTFGLRCSEQDRNHYINLASEHLDGDVRLYEIRRVKNTFRFERSFLSINPSKKRASPVLRDHIGLLDDTSLADTHPEIEAMLQHDQFAGALPLIEEAVKTTPDSAKLWRAKGVALGHRLQHQDALDCFEKAIDIKQSFFSAWYQKGVALMLLEKYPEAALAYEKARELIPIDGSTLFNLAAVRWQLGEKTEALKLFHEAAKCGHPRAAEVLRDLEPG